MARTLHDKLVCTPDKRQAIIVVERLRDVLSEGVPCSSRRDTPSATIVGVGPKQVTHRSFMRNLLYAVDCAYVVESVDRRRKPSVEAEYLLHGQVRTPSHSTEMIDLKNRWRDRGPWKGGVADVGK